MPTLQDIRDKVRKVTARYNQEQLTDDQIDTYINTFYMYELPENFRTLKLLVPFVFTTIPNQACYDFPYQEGFTDPNGKISPGYLNVKPPVYCQGYRLRYFQDKDMFYGTWPKRSSTQLVATGDGDSFYEGTIPFFPMLRGELDIFGNVTVSNVIFSIQNSSNLSSEATVINDKPVQDSSLGQLTLVQNGVETILPDSFVNYLTGEWQLTLPFSVPSTDGIYVQAIPYQPSRPVDVLFYNQQFIFRPVPIAVFQVEFQAMKTPTQMIASSDAPELNEWWQYLALGAAKLVYTDFPDPEGLDYCLKLLQEQMQLVQRRTLVQLSTQRANTIFSTPTRPNYAGYFLPYNQ